MDNWIQRFREQASLTAVVAFAMSSYQLAVGYLGEPIPYIHRPIHLAFIIALFYLLRISASMAPRRTCKTLWYLVMGALGVAACVYVVVNASDISMRMTYVSLVDTTQIVLASALILVLVDAACRTIGWPLAALGLMALAYTVLGPYMPGPLWHQGFEISRTLEQSYLTLGGLWSAPLGVSAGTIFLFVLFGALLLSSGAGEFFTDLANALTGRQAGGAANTAVLSSAFMGMLSGSAAANVVTTGTLTIPAMRRSGFSAHFAAGIEACASSGGAITPPVMGAAAFIMVEMIGMPYSTVIGAAAVPAVLYFVACYISVNLEAHRLGLRPDPSDVRPRVHRVLLTRGYLLLPVVALLYYLLHGYPAETAAFWSILYLLCLVVLVADGRRPIKLFAALVPIIALVLYGLGEADAIGALSGGLVLAAAARLVSDLPVAKRLCQVVWDGFVDAPKLMIPITIATAVGGLVIGVVSLTGLGERISTVVLYLAHGSQFLTLFYTLLAGVVLGMGMPIAGAYVVLAALLGPTLTGILAPMYVHSLGLSPAEAHTLALLAAHLFIIYAASWSNLTPPVAIAVYAAAAIAGASPMRTAVAALKIGFPIFVMPFVFVYQPQLLSQLGAMRELFPLVTALLGIVAISAAAIGWFIRALAWPWRLLFLAAGFLMVGSSHWGSIAGVVIVLALAGWLYVSRRPAAVPAGQQLASRD